MKNKKPKQALINQDELCAQDLAISAGASPTINQEVGTCCYSSHIPNEETIKVIESVKAGKNLVSAENAEDLFKKLGI